MLFELLEPVEAERGLALAATTSAGDLFFDIEGDPFVEEGGADGLEYLFGVIEPGDGLGLDPAFHAFWGLDREGEKRAFEQLIDFFMDRLALDPNIHIYHYGAYEPSALSRLMGRHATREDEVDQLLRADVFVDLYRAVRQGMRVSWRATRSSSSSRCTACERTIASATPARASSTSSCGWTARASKQDLLDQIRGLQPRRLRLHLEAARLAGSSAARA